MTAQHTYGYADLDAANRNHYGRGKPYEMREAEIDCEIANNELDAEIDRYYYGQDYGDPEAQLRLKRAHEKADRAELTRRALAVKYGYQQPSDFVSEPEISEIKF